MPSAARLVDLQGDDVELYLDIVNAANRRLWGAAAKTLTADDLRVETTKSEDDQRYYLWWVDDLALGALDLLLHRDDADAGWAQVCVREEYQGYRIGSRLLEFGEELARRHRRSFMRGMSSGRSLRDDRTTRFLKKAGYREVNSLLRQDLLLPNETLQRCEHDAIRDLEAIIVTGVPELSVCAEICQIWHEQYAADGSESGPPDYSPDGLQQFQRRIVESGRYSQFALLLDTRSGAVVGLSEMDYRPGEAFAEQFETYVKPQFRSEASLQLLKWVGTHALIDACPDVPRVRTLNPTQNTLLIEANTKLGYTNTGYYREWEKRLV